MIPVLQLTRGQNPVDHCGKKVQGGRYDEYVRPGSDGVREVTLSENACDDGADETGCGRASIGNGIEQSGMAWRNVVEIDAKAETSYPGQAWDTCERNVVYIYVWNFFLNTC